MEIGEIRFEKTSTLDLDAFRALTRAQLGKLRIFSVFFAALGCILGALYIRFPREDPDFFLPFFLILMAVAMPLIPWLTVRISMKKQQSILIPTRYRFGEDAFSQQTELAQGSLSYRGVERIVLCRGHLLIYPTGLTAYILPLQNFAVGEAEALPDFLSQKTGKKVERIGRQR